MNVFFKLLVVLLAIQLTCFISKSEANVADIQLNNVSVEQGLSSRLVLDIIEDKHGYIWVATSAGINRYDGRHFKNYLPRKSSGNQLPLEIVRNLHIDANQQLWMAAEGGLAKYDELTDSFVVYDEHNSQLTTGSIWDIAETESGRLIVSSNTEIFEYHSQVDDFSTVRLARDEVLGSPARKLFADGNRIWIGTTSTGTYTLDLQTNQLLEIPPSVERQFSQLLDFKRIGNENWLATDNGVFVLDANFAVLKHLHANADDGLNIVANYVRSIETDTDGKIWMGTYGGISIYSPTTSTIFSVDRNNSLHVGLGSLYIIKAFKDSSGSLWFGSFSSGLYQYHPRIAAIKHFQDINRQDNSDDANNIWAFADNGDGRVWIPTHSGSLYLYDIIDGNFVQFDYENKSTIWSIGLDADKRLWVASEIGLNIYRFDGERLTLEETFFENQNIVDLIDLNGQFWVKDLEGNLFKQTLGDTTSFEKITIDGYTRIDPLFRDEDNNVWIQTEESGLIRMSADHTKFRQLSLSNSDSEPRVYTIHETPHSLWLSTGKQGILELDKKTLNVKQRIHPRGYDSTGFVVNSVLDPNDKYTVWQSNQSEIWQISLETGELLRVLPRGILDYNELNQGAVAITHDSVVFFGGSNGFHIFNPAKLKDTSMFDVTTGKATTQISAPTLTGLRVHNKQVEVGEDASPLKTPLIMTDEITLSYFDIPFSIEFGHINSPYEHELNYRYRLLGWRNTWFETEKSSRLATFSIETHGEHIFEVQGRSGEGEWSETRRLKVFISPPFWFSQPALVLYSILSVLLLLYVLRQYQRKLSIQNAIRESEERLKLTLWSSGDELWDWDVYRGQVYRANTWGTIDFPQDDIRANSSYQANIHPNDMLRVQQALNDHIGNQSDYFQVTYRAKTFRGEWIWVLDRGMIVKRDGNDQPLRMTGTLKNISHLKQAEEQLKLYERSIETISDGVFIADTTFKFITVNHSYCQYTGETRDQATASYLKFNQYPDAFTEEIKKALLQKGNWNGEVESRRINGERYEMELNIDAISGEDGKTTHFVGVFSDITSRKNTEKELLKLANTDPLTEMPNRSFFQASHDNLVRKDVPHALVCLDMDNFKKINDSLGHQTGDILIKQIGKRLQNIAGTNSTCYRLGGDEFSILVDNEEEMARINHYAQRILDQMAHPFLINKQEFVLGASVGIAFYPEDGNNPQELLKNADTAMYFAKNAGGNKYQFFSGEMNQNAVRQLQIENLIRYGLKEDLFTVYYQPKVDIATGKLVSMEALVRFEHPEKGIVSPAQFIPLAEETGQIIEIGEQVLKKACEDTKRWVAQGLFTGRVAVNISARQFELPDLDDRIVKILQKVGLSPLHLECEITEGTLMQHPEQALQLMQRLREKGIHLALDDFGTGYSSLAYLKKFPLNTLKIDKAFIDDIATSNVDKHMTAAIINIAHNLGLKVVAEGVEQEKQLDILRRYECEMLQGYLYSKPLNAAKFERLLGENLHISQLIDVSPSDKKPVTPSK